MAAAPVLSLAATGFSVASSLMGGKSKAEGAAYQSAQADRASRYGLIKADQTQQYMEENLQGTLANIDAVRASANTDPDSPTGFAIRNFSEARGERDINNRVSSIRAQSAEDANAAAFYKKSASSAMMGGYLGASGSLLSGLSGMAGGMGGGGGGYSGDPSSAIGGLM